jgi:hypothetical protein
LCLYVVLFAHLELDEFMHALDKRLEKTAKEAPGLVAKKERKLGLPSTSAPPKEAPRWAVKTSTAAQHSDAENDPESEFLM